MNTLQQQIESLLFYKNEPVSFSWLAKKLNLNVSEIKECLISMINFYHNRGITIILSDDSASLLTAEISRDIISQISKTEERGELSKQAMETLAIILYKKKITKPEIDYIRGVNSVFMLRNLLIRGLIEKHTNPHDKRSSLYSVTHDTYSFLGIQQITDLPQYEHFNKKLEQLENDWKEDVVSEDGHTAVKLNINQK